MRRLKDFFISHVIKIAFFIIVATGVFVFFHYEKYRGSPTVEYGEIKTAKELEALLIIPTGQDVKTMQKNLTKQKALYHFTQGELASLREDVNTAISHFKQALKHDPEAAFVHSRLGEEYMKRSDYVRSKQHLQTALKLNDKLIAVHFLLGNIAAAEKKYKEAIDHYKTVIQLDPDKEQAYVLLATVYAEQNNYTDAIGILKTLTQANPDSFLGFYYLGRVYSDLGKERLAIANYEKSLAVYPSFPSAITALGVLYEKNNQMEKAVKLYLKVLQAGSADSRLLRRTIRLLVAKKDYQRVLKLLEEMKLQDPGNLNTRVRIGLVFYEMEKYERAKKEFLEILAEHPDSDRIHYYLSAVYEKLNDNKNALSSLKKVSKGSSFYKDSVRNQTLILVDMKKSEEAVALVREAIAAFPQESELYELLASIYEQDKKYEDATKVIAEAQRKFPKDEQLLYYLGILYDKMGDIKLSLKVMNQLLKVNPNHADALNFVGYTYLVQRTRMEEAERMIRKALKIKPGYGYIEDSLGWVYYVKGDYKKAEKLLEKAASLRPGEAVILDHLADAYVKLDKVEKAYGTYQKALKLNPDTKTRVKIENKLRKLSNHELIKKRFPAQDK